VTVNNSIKVGPLGFLLQMFVMTENIKKRPVFGEAKFLLLCRPAFLKLWSADHKWSSGSALVVLLGWTLVKKRQKK
jgi:hypothetical protein